MSLFDLVNRAAINEHCSKSAGEIFEWTFGHKLIKIGKRLPDRFDEEAERITDLELGANILKYFGHLISKLSLQDQYCTSDDVAQANQLLSSVDKYSRDSLVRFDIHYSDCDVDTFSKIQRPFKKAENVSIHLYQTLTNTDNLRLNEIFPRVWRLELDFKRVTNPNFLDCELRYLEGLGLADGIFDASLGMETAFTNFLRKNPQIVYLSLIAPTQKGLQLINKHLTNLVELRILLSIPDDSSFNKISFPSVKRLNLWLPDGGCHPPKKITFGTMLDDIALLCNDIGNDYFNFLFKYSHIRKLSAGAKLTDSHLQKLIGKLPKLSEAFFDFKDDVSAQNIVKFVKKSKKLNELKFYYPSNNHPDQLKQQLEKGLATDFNIHLQNVPYSQYMRTIHEFLIERKIPIESKPNGASKHILSFNGIVAIILVSFGRIFFL